MYISCYNYNFINLLNHTIYDTKYINKVNLEDWLKNI